MENILLATLAERFFKARSVNETSNGYRSLIPTVTEPSGDAGTATGASILDNQRGGGAGQNCIRVLPYAIGSNNNTFSLRVIGWDYVGNNPNPGEVRRLWIPTPLCEVACTISSTQVGIVNSQVLNTEMFADTISLTYGNLNVGIDIVSTAADIVAHFVLDLKGCQKYELIFTTGGSATSCNALIKKY